MTSKRWWTTDISYIDMIYLPYTAMSVSYIIIGAMFSKSINWSVLALLTFVWFIGVGFLSHSLDELKGHPLGTGIPDYQLKIIAIISLIITFTIFFYLAITINGIYMLIYCIIVFLAIAYNLELFEGTMHKDATFMISFGLIPQIIGYYGMANTVPSIGLLIVFIGLTSVCGVETVVNHFVKFQSIDYQKAYDNRFSYLQRAVWGAVFLPTVVAIGLILIKLGV